MPSATMATPSSASDGRRAAGNTHGPASVMKIVATTSPPTAPSNGLLRTDRRRERPAAEQPPGIQLRRVADDNGSNQQHCGHAAAGRLHRGQHPERHADIPQRQEPGARAIDREPEKHHFNRDPADAKQEQRQDAGAAWIRETPAHEDDQEQ